MIMQPDFQKQTPHAGSTCDDAASSDRKMRVGKILFITAGVICFVVLMLLFRFDRMFSVISGDKSNFAHLIAKYMPAKEDNYEEKNRLDILLMGIRGQDDPYGGLLTDSMMVLSYDTEKGTAAILSVPRDLYVQIPGVKYDKINAAYVHGEQIERGFGLQLAKITVGYVLGIDIDYAVLIDFSGFQKLIDAVGGIDVLTEKEFKESQQWQGMEIAYGSGINHLNGEQALYYTRARFMSSDFDRARRQQEVLVALKDKLLSMDVLANPFKVKDILNLVEENVTIDLDRTTLLSMAPIIKTISDNSIARVVLRNGDQGLLYSATVDGAYVLLPRDNDFKSVRKFARNILN